MTGTLSRWLLVNMTSHLKHFEKLIPLEPPNIQTAPPSSDPPLAPAAPSADVPPPPPPAPIG